MGEESQETGNRISEESTVCFFCDGRGGCRVNCISLSSNRPHSLAAPGTYVQRITPMGTAVVLVRTYSAQDGTTHAISVLPEEQVRVVQVDGDRRATLLWPRPRPATDHPDGPPH